MLKDKLQLTEEDLTKINGGRGCVGTTFGFDCPLCSNVLYTDKYIDGSIVNCSCNHSFKITCAGRRRVGLKDTATGSDYWSDVSEC